MLNAPPNGGKYPNVITGMSTFEFREKCHRLPVTYVIPER